MKKKGFDLNSLLNAKSQGAAVQGDAESEPQDAFCVEMIDVDDLIPSRNNFYNTDDIDQLAEAIELSGIEQNLTVKPKAHGKYEVIAGHRRRLAVLKLVSEGKEAYRKVPCRIRKESDHIRDRLTLILTNSTARELTDWEKVQQAKELKNVLQEYKKALAEENRERPQGDKIKIGRIRALVADMLHTSETQIGRMEAIDKNLSGAFKEEMQKGNIGISAAHEISRLEEAEQQKMYERYAQKGELHLKDIDAGQKDTQDRKDIQDRKDAQNHKNDKTIQEDMEQIQGETTMERQNKEVQEKEEAAIPGQMEIYDYPEYLLQGEKDFLNRTKIRDDLEDSPQEVDKNPDFDSWIVKKYGMHLHECIEDAVGEVILQALEADENQVLYPELLEEQLTDVLSEWIRQNTEKYKQDLVRS